MTPRPTLPPRVNRLLEGLPSLRQGEFFERRLLMQESYARTVGEPQVLRQAKAFAHMLANMIIEIGPDELIVGRHPKRVPSEDDRTALAEVAANWRGPDLGRWVSSLLSEDQKVAQAAGMYTSCSKTGHMAPDFQTVLTLGLEGVRGEAERKLGALDLGDPTYPEKAAFLQACILTLDGACLFARRYSDLAFALAAEEANPTRKEELAMIGEACRRVPMKPPRSFHQALQSVWLIHLLCCMECCEGHAAFAPGRFDQYLVPFFEADAGRGTLTEGQALELLECLWIKFNEIGDDLPQTLTVGGLRPDGADGTNRLTYLCLEASDALRKVNPSLCLRVHPGTPHELLLRAAELIRTGIGFPQLYNDEVAVAAMEKAGATPQDARDYMPGGCVELSVMGKTNPWVGNFLNLPKCLELALNNGCCPLSGDPIGPPTGAAEDLRTFEDLLLAYQTQVERTMELMVASENAWDLAQRYHSPYPFLSSLVDDCIETATDITAGGARYDFNELQGVGIATTADPLAAIRKLVFEDRRLSLRELVQALRENFEGHEALRQSLLREAPKYGNDDPAVDNIAVAIVGHFYDQVARYRNPRGGPYVPGLLVWTLARDFGYRTGASADGRKAGEVFADSIGPAQARDRHGPTAVIASVTKLDYTPVVGGLSFNLKFTPQILQTSDGLEKFLQLVRTYFARGGMQVQVNVVDGETLRAAQREPEKYGDLIVRVSGWSACFVTLGEALQNDIIARTESVL